MDYEKMSKDERMANLKALIDKQKLFFQYGQTRPLSFRAEQLNRLKTGIKAYEKNIRGFAKRFKQITH